LEGLSAATVIPHVRILSQFPEVEEVFLITIERNAQPEDDFFEGEPIKHISVRSSHRLSDKILDQSKAKRALRSILRDNEIDLMIARSVLAAWICEQTAKTFDLPYVVESFEPHTQYMIEDGIWNKGGVKSRLLQRSEDKQKHEALRIFTVTERYRQELIAEGVSSERVKSIPCTANPELFAFDPNRRRELRAKMELRDDVVVGVYTGKLGGIYLEDEALGLFLTIKNELKNRGRRFFLLVLSPDHLAWSKKLVDFGMTEEDYSVDFVSQQKVADYCSAADFAFSLHRPRPSKIAISPIKNAEFWMSGLPVVIPEGIGDDSHAVVQYRLGVRLSALESITSSELDLLLELQNQDRLTGPIRTWALQNRTYRVVESSYSELLELF
jgi:hypothetical protein